MKLVEISKAGNLYFQMSDGRFGIIYPKSGYVRVSTVGVSRDRIMKWPLRLYQINKTKPEGKRERGEVSRVLVFSIAEQFEMLLKFDIRNCGGLQS
jgi:hypothetical protein